MIRFIKSNMWLIAVAVALLLAAPMGLIERACAGSAADVVELTERISQLNKEMDELEKEVDEWVMDLDATDSQISFYILMGKWIELMAAERERDRLKRELETASAGCFLPDTKVLMADGTYLEISRLKDGDMVKSFNIKEGRVEDKRVLGAFTYKDYSKSHYLINRALRVTGRHRFLMAGPGESWKRANQLKVGDRVKSMERYIIIRSIEKITEENTVYNFIVSDSKNYFVSDGKGHYLVHNGGK